MEQINLDDRLFFRNCSFNSSNEVESFLSDQLFKYGYVKKEYKNAILKREKEFPTGLPSSSPAIAIPHADTNLVNKTTIAVLTLDKAVTFKNMAVINENVDVQIVIMLALSEPHSQVEMLQKIVEIVQSENLRRKICNTNSNQELISLIKKELQGEI
ncbi:PTS system galactitol-specific IIA component [Lactobacillus colini]|uniref:PTS system galactitol-specific IIA component n=1 Tax=Lactobacillus colini TaxID=1819254 RepID=A0ABS4MFP6_9LACO|nr:PTS sugar transporter subunit IIA [Lactobacillus colini]MBP2058499.1 PTS system galactitol-specific IIA component [Lactobacillus colini]